MIRHLTRHLAISALLFVGVGTLAAADQPAVAADAPKVERLKPEQWCWTHDLPKDKCTTCDRKLIPALKKAKDWCPEHECAESVCLKCDPASKASLDALRPAEKPKVAK